MALRESLRGAVGALRTRPELFVLGGAIGLLQAALYALVLAGLSAVAPVATTLLEGVAVVVSLFVVLPLFVALYELALDPRPSEPTSAALRRAVGRSFGAYPRVLTTAAAVGLVSALLGVAVALGWYVVATAGRYGRYALADPGSPAAMESVVLLAAAALVGAYLGSTALRFADAVVVYEEREPVAALVASAVACRQNLSAVVGFAVAVVAIHLASIGALVGVSAAAPADGSFGQTGLIAVAVALHGVAVTLVAVCHAAFYRDHVAPAGRAVPESSRSPFRGRVGRRTAGRVVIAFVLVAALVSGAAAVRTLDPAVHSPPELGPLGTDDPDEAVRTAVATTSRANHRQVLYERNASDPGADYRVLKRAGYDHADRQLYVYFTKRDGEEFGGFFGDGTLAMLRPGGRLDGFTAYERGPWQVLAAPGWGLADGSAAATSAVVPGGDAGGWEVVSANASTLVVRYDDPNTIDDALGPRAYEGMTEPLANESHVTAVIDRERGVFRSVRLHVHSLETGTDRQYRVDYREVGTADLRRPEPIRDRRLAERLWDAVYY